MVLTTAEYQIILDRLFQINRSDNNIIIRQLKNHFRDKINSPRRLDRINSLSQLITILEKRNVIGSDNLSALQYITNVIGPHDSIIQNIFDNRTQGNLPNQNINNLESNRLPRNERVLQPLPVDRITRIHTLIKSDVGRKWRELARALEIKEGKIDSLDERYRGYIPDIVNEILRLHHETYGLNFELWRSRLQDALILARRTDLSDRINEILAHVPIQNVVH